MNVYDSQSSPNVIVLQMNIFGSKSGQLKMATNIFAENEEQSSKLVFD